MTKSICPKHEWGYTLAEGCPWCPPKPRTRVYRKGEPVTDVHVGMFLRCVSGLFLVQDVSADEAELVWNAGSASRHSLESIRKYCVYAEDFEAPEAS